MGRFGNISIRLYKKILTELGLEYVRTKAGHEMWFKEGMLCNIVFQTHEEPVPEDVIFNNIRTIGITSKEFENAMRKVK